MTTIPYVGTAPAQAHQGDAGADLVAKTTITLHVGKHAVIPTGCSVAIPEGHVGQICPRSGLAARYAITVLNSPGIIDAGYRGEIGAVVINHGPEPVTIKKGDRIAQLVILPHSRPVYTPVDKLDDATDRGTGGFGSTGA
ncbi:MULTISPECIES: dUTP diphosphatase [Corynebacterium]|uniref:dUTP diphosphatase n=1 Tax=Corynebacterium TaxID=1716 RepID=UPI00124E7564|nr:MULTISPECIES: dUTP diphosphatase [Corynebacterium]